MKKGTELLIIGVALLLVIAGLSWAYVRRGSYWVINTQYESFIWDGKKPIAPPYITKEEAKKEVNQLIYALENYIGYTFIKSDVEEAIRQLKALQYGEKIAVKTWYKQLYAIIEIIPDKHAGVALNGIKRISSYTNHNINQSRLPWMVASKKLKGKKVLLIGIVRFPDPPSSEWKGFLEKVEAGLKEAEVIVLDLRGNKGGHDGMGRALARLLYNNQSWPYPVKKIVRMHHPIAYIIQANWYRVKIKRMKAKGLVTDQLEKWYTDLIKKARYYKVGSPVFKDQHYKQQTLSDNVPSIPIFILIDRHCGSSGENMVDFLEGYPQVVKIGEPTAGAIHFGNMGFFVLPYSKVMIFLGTQYKIYYDERMLEGKGIAPDYYVATKDAFPFFLRMLNRPLSKRRSA